MITEPETVFCPPMFASITSLVPDWEVSKRVTVLSTMRSGGVSRSPYASLNLGLHVNDDPEHVSENRRRLESAFALPASPVWLNQVHSSDIVQLPYDADPKNTVAIPCADGAWTDDTDTVLAVLTADCLPVVLCDREGSRVAVVHAGWKGLASGILENALRLYSDTHDLHAWLAPAIGPSIFEVGEDVLEAMSVSHPARSSHFKPTEKKGKYMLDIYALASAIMRENRSVTVTGGEYCTHTQNKRFHSYRRDGAKSGRMATIAWISNG